MGEEEQRTDDTPGTKEPETKAPSIQEQVNTLVSAMTQDDSGKWQLPEEYSKDLSEAVVFAVNAERRLRDTQSGYTKSRQKLKELETVNSELTQHMITNATMHLTDEEKEEVEDLRTSNPEKWRETLNTHEQTAQKLQKEKIGEFETKGKAASESELRTLAYQEFTQRTGVELSDDVIDTQVPASFPKKLAAGEWTFDEFLTQIESFLSSDKVIKGAKDDPKKHTSMKSLAGGREPSEEAQTVDDAVSYKSEVY